MFGKTPLLLATAFLALLCATPARAADMPIPPDFPGLVDGRGHALDTSAPKFHLVAFGFSHCSDVCAPTLEGLRLVLARLGARKAQRLQMVFVTLDPKRDSPPALAKFVRQFDRRIVALGGPYEDIMRTAQAYRIQVGHEHGATPSASHHMAHTPRLTLTGPDGRVVGLISAEQSPARIAATVLQVLEADAQWQEFVQGDNPDGVPAHVRQ